MRNILLSRVKSGFLAKFFSATLILAAAPAMVAQSSPIVFKGWETYNWGTGSPGYGSAIGLTTDSAGNLYVSEPGQARIRKVTPDGTRTVYLTTGTKQPKGMVVDWTSNLWYVDSQPVSGTLGTTITMHPLNGSPEATIGGFNDPVSITVDSLNNLYVVNQGDNHVMKVTAGVVSPFITGPTLPAQARGIVIDNSNNMYIGDVSGNKVYQYNATTGAFVRTFVPSAGCQVRDLAINSVGDLFVGCQTPASTIYRVPFEGTTVNVAHQSLVNATGMAAGVHGLTFGGGILFAANGTNTVDKIQIDAVDLGSFTITPEQSLATSATLTFASISDTATPINTSAYSEGIAYDPGGNATNDYQLTAPASGTDCTTLTSLGPINTGSATCSVKVNFWPNGVGARHGSVVFASNGVKVFNQPIAGIGLGSRVAFGQNPPLEYTVLADGKTFSVPAAVVSDGGGNRFVADTGNHRVVEFPAGSFNGIVVGAGFVYPVGVAVDAAGNLYVSDAAFGLSIVPNENGTINTAHQRVVTPDVQFSTGIRFDKYQNLYIADSFQNRIVKVPYENGQLNGSHLTTVGTGFVDPEGVYPDVSGNVWVADTAFDAQELTGGRIVKVAPDGTQTTVPIDTAQIPGGLGYPTDLVLDQAGDIYISDTNNYRLLYISSDLSIQTTIVTKQNTVEPGFGAFGGLWNDPSGTVYITDSLNNTLVQINSGSFDLTFPSTSVGSTSAPQVIQTSNIGNQPLDLKALTFPTDFQQSPVGSTEVPDCTATTSLVGGKSCSIGVSFKPTSAGAKNEPLDVVTTDLNANVSPYRTDTFNLIGAAIGTLSLTPTSLTFPVTVNNVGPYTPQQITVKNIGTVTTVVSVALGAGTAADFHITSTTCGVSVPVNGTCTVSITFQPTAGSGVRTGTMVATDSLGNTATATLSGTATTASLVTVPFGLNFTSSVGVASPTQTFTVYNYSSRDLSISFSGVTADFVLTSDCPSAPNRLPARTGTCLVTVYFKPVSATPTTKTAVVTVKGTPNSDQTITTVTLTGTVTTPAAAVAGSKAKR